MGYAIGYLTKHVMISVSENGDFTTNKLQD